MNRRREPHTKPQTIRETTIVTKLLLGLALAAGLCGCGASSKSRANGTADLSSSAGLNGGITSNGAECNIFDTHDSRLAGRITSYYYNGVAQEDRVRVRITSLAASFSSSATQYIQFFRWRADANGNTQLDSTPLTFSLERGSPSQPFTGTMTAISLADVNTFRTMGAIPGTTAQDFFNNVTIVVTGVDYNWAVLKAVLYDGTSAIAQTDVLLPIYTANPNTYSQTHKTVLNQLHPFWSIRGGGLSDADYLSRARAFCF